MEVLPHHGNERKLARIGHTSSDLFSDALKGTLTQVLGYRHYRVGNWEGMSYR